MSQGNTSVNIDIDTDNFTAFAAANEVDFHDGDKLRLYVWVGNGSEMERLAEISWTGAAADAIIGYDADGATDHDRDTFLLEAVIGGLQTELERRMRNNFEALPEPVKALIDGYAELAEGRPRTRREEGGICCPGVADGGGHDHGTFTVEL